MRMARLPCGVALTAATLAALCGLAAPAPAAAQAPLGIRTASGLTVTPVYEGWYENPDGTFSLSFGYYNRNFEEVVEVPLGEGNRMEPGGPRRRAAPRGSTRAGTGGSSR